MCAYSRIHIPTPTAYLNIFVFTYVYTYIYIYSFHTYHCQEHIYIHVYIYIFIYVYVHKNIYIPDSSHGMLCHIFCAPLRWTRRDTEWWLQSTMITFEAFLFATQQKLPRLSFSPSLLFFLLQPLSTVCAGFSAKKSTRKCSDRCSQ